MAVSKLTGLSVSGWVEVCGWNEGWCSHACSTLSSPDIWCGGYPDAELELPSKIPGWTGLTLRGPA